MIHHVKKDIQSKFILVFWCALIWGGYFQVGIEQFILVEGM